MTQPTKLSPLHTTAESLGAHFTERAGWRMAAHFGGAAEVHAARDGVTLADMTLNRKIQIQGEKAATFLETDDLAIGAGREVEGGFLYRLRSDLFWWHGEADIAENPDFFEKSGFSEDDLITVTDITPGCAELWLIGPNSPLLLSRLCGLDFHERHFPNHTAKRSSVAKTTQTIIHHNRGDLPAYILIGRRSFAAYLWQTIIEAGADLNIQPIGLDAFKQLA